MLLIFDLDGTLFQAKAVVLGAARRLIAELGFPECDEYETLKNAARGSSALLRNVVPEGADLDAARTRYYELLYDSVRECGELFPGVREAVEELYREGHELVICSNSHAGYIKTVLEHTGLEKYFARYYCAAEYGSKAELVRELACQTDKAVVIGDTHGDIEAAEKNGLPSVAAAYGYGNKSMLAAATLTVLTPAGLVPGVRSLEGK